MNQGRMLNPRPQQGAALIVGLVFLLIMTMIGIAAIQSSSTEERMAGNLRDNNASFQAAEAALRVAEITLKNRSESGAGYYADPGTAPDPAVFSNWSSSSANTVTSINFTAGSLTLVKNAPLYTIEKQEPVPSNLSSETVENREIEPFIISAYSTGGSGEANVVLQSAYRRKHEDKL